MSAELLERAASAGGQLLKVERQLGAGGEGRAPGFVLTFDVGRVWVRADPAAGTVATEEVAAALEVPGGVADAAEEEPWWRVLGNPITAVSAVDAGAGGPGVRLKLRHDADNPRVIVLTTEGGLLRANLES